VEYSFEEKDFEVFPALDKKSIFRASELPAWIRRGGCTLKKFRQASLVRADGAVD
jgi:hypothetical protein